MRVLILDIETAPNLAHVWRLWQTDVGLNQLIVPGYILCFAAKWLDERTVHFARVKHDARTGRPTAASQRAMLAKAHALLSEADVVVHYNGVSFDIPRLNAEFLECGFAPPAPFAQVDLYRAIKKRASFPNHKLAYVAERLGVGSKVKHEGHVLWRKCMADEAAAWGRMKRYNVGDVRLTEDLYKRILPWIPGHPNRALFVSDTEPRCPHCASTSLQRRGVTRTSAQTYVRYQCNGCGAWSRGTKKQSAAIVRRSA